MNESVQKWLDELTADPVKALQRLVLGQAGVLAWSRASMGEIFLEIFQTHAGTLDEALAEWLSGRLMKLPPERVPLDVWAARLEDVFRAITGLPLPKVARLLRDRLRDFRLWLRPLRYEDALDPEAACLSALAWAETNQHLEGMWRAMALRQNREPRYYADIGLLGLRKTRDESGQLPAKAPFILLATLIDLADARGTSRDDWMLTARAIMGGYHYRLETWVREFTPVLEARPAARNGPEWLREILPLSSTKAPTRHDAPLLEPVPLAESDAMVREVQRRGLDGPGLESFLTRHRDYANATHNPHYLVRTFNRLAEAARTQDPDWAVKRAEEALAWDECNPRNWTVLAHCLWARGFRAHRLNDPVKAQADCREALDSLWTARYHFPYNAYVRTELGRLHQEAGDLTTAEAIYREAMIEFPANVVCRCGLAEAFIAQGEYQQAEAVFRNAMQAIPDSPGSRDGLAGMFTNLGRIPEAERLYRDTRARFPSDPYCRNGLADILFHRSAETGSAQEREEARELFREAAELGNQFASGRLNGFDQRWQRLANKLEAPPAAERESSEAISFAMPEPSEMRPAQRLGRALLLQWQARRAESAETRGRLFSEAEKLLDLPEPLAGDCWTAFVEARGFLLLARDRVADARVYFDAQLAVSGGRRHILRLGLAEARARLGETLSEDEEATLASLGPEGSILPLVLKVLRLLEFTESDAALRDVLLRIYPRVRELAGMPPSEVGENEERTPAAAALSRGPETADTMMAHLLAAHVFRPADIVNIEDLRTEDALSRVRTTLKAHRDDIFSVVEKLALAA